MMITALETAVSAFDQSKIDGILATRPIETEIKACRF